jgi:hypothetical protein
MLDQSVVAGDDVSSALLAAEFAERGFWPTGGGWLDQPRILVDAVLAVWADQAGMRAASRG